MENDYSPDRLSAVRPYLQPSEKETVVLFGETLADIFPDLRVWGGAPFNVAKHLHAFGLQSILITCLGLDPLGDELFEAISKNGMQTAGVQRTDRYPTGRVEVDFADGGHRFSILSNQAYDHIDGDLARRLLRSACPKLVYFGSLAQRAETSRNALYGLLDEKEAVKFFDINLRHPWYGKDTLERSLLSADILKLNNEELDLIAAMFGLDERQPEGRLAALMSRFQLSQIVLTRGEEGAWLLTGDGTLLKAGQSSAVAAIADTVGAGDAFSSICILGIMRSWPLHQTIQKANEFASAVCGIRGALPEEHGFYQQHRNAWTL